LIMAKIDITQEQRGMFHVALDAANPGDEIIYHIGEHAKGPHKKHALDSAMFGICMIYQRRLDYGQFAYIALKTKR